VSASGRGLRREKVETNGCDACYNEYTHIHPWMSYTPEFQQVIMLISSPVAQLVALWGMTNKSMLQLMMTSKRDKTLAITLEEGGGGGGGDFNKVKTSASRTASYVDHNMT
jgi:hypothetical protein